MEYRQSVVAVVVSRSWLAILTGFFSYIYDYLVYRNTRLYFGDKFVVFETGALTKRGREMPHEDILSVKAEQSIVGQVFNYGTVIVIMKDRQNTIVFKCVNNPNELRKALQKNFIGSRKFKVI